MDIKKLEVLMKVIETKSLTAAGNQLGFTQSGVSHLIKTIEDEFGFPVLIRGKGGVRLTENGRALLPAIREILNANDHMDQIVAEHPRYELRQASHRHFCQRVCAVAPKDNRRIQP